MHRFVPLLLPLKFLSYIAPYQSIIISLKLGVFPRKNKKKIVRESHRWQISSKISPPLSSFAVHHGSDRVHHYLYTIEQTRHCINCVKPSFMAGSRDSAAFNGLTCSLIRKRGGGGLILRGRRTPRKGRGVVWLPPTRKERGRRDSRALERTISTAWNSQRN